jgi:hypothetical protein
LSFAVPDLGSTSIGQLSQDGFWRWDGAAWKPAGGSPRPAGPPWASMRIRERASWSTVAWVAGIGLLADQALRTSTMGLAASAAFALAAAALIVTGRARRLEPLFLCLTSALLAAFITIRASPWLVWSDAAACAALLGLGASMSIKGSIFDLGFPEVAARMVHASVHMITGTEFAARPLIEGRSRLSSLAAPARGLIIATPIAALLLGLLASADPVFASFLNLNVDVSRLALDGLFVVVGSAAAAGLLRYAAAEPTGEAKGSAWRLGGVEALVVLAVLDAIFAAFALSQLLAASGAANAALKAAGVSYSDYARSGFFQLLWVSGITLVVLVALSRLTSLSSGGRRRAFVGCALGAIVLTLLVVFVAFRRLSLYEDAYGFTMLRLYSHVFAVFIALVFALLAAELVGLWRGREWFIGVTLVVGLVALLGLNVMNPEALVVELNVAHAHSTHRIDVGYLAGLSSDATPSLVSSLPQLDPTAREKLRIAECAGTKTYSVAFAALNLADQQAALARRAGC